MPRFFKKPRDQSGSRSVTPWSLWNWPRIISVLKVLSLAVVVAAGCWFWPITEQWLDRYVATHRSGGVTARQAVLADAPLWMGRSIRARLREAVVEVATNNPLDPRSLLDAASSLERIAWIERVHQVRRTFDGRVVVHADYRTPVAAARSRHGFHLVDRHGVRLPGLYLRHAAKSLGLPLIVGSSQPLPDVGKRWSGKELLAAISLAQLLAGEPYTDQVEAIDVGGRDPTGSVHLVLRTAQGLVRWGLPPGLECPIEPDAKKKKLLLAQVASQHGGSIDAGGRIVDIYDGNIFIHTSARGGGAVRTGYTALGE